MHPYIAQELTSAHNQDMLAAARRNTLVNRLRSATRASRKEQASLASHSVPEIPDYVHELLDVTEVDASRTC